MSIDGQGYGTDVPAANPDTAPEGPDPVLADAVEEALAGPVAGVASPADPNRTLGADPHDFAGLYIRHRSSFAAQARRFHRDPRDVDEVVQEAFLRLFLALPELESELQALAYCRRTVTNLCIDRYRADKRRPRLVNIEALPASDFPDEQLDDPVVQAEDAAFVREALALLTPLHRDALVKREIEEKSIPVIAVELGVPEDSVKHLLHRARRALRRHLAKTHLAPGADLDDTSTLSLLAKSAVSGGGRIGVVVAFLMLVVVGTKPDVTSTVLASWPIEEIKQAVTQALAPVTTEPKPEPVRERVRAPRAPVELPAPTVRSVRRIALPEEDAIALAPRAKVLPVASAPATKPTPAPPASPSATASGSPTPSASGGPSSSVSPAASSSPSASSSPTATPSASPSSSKDSDGAKPRVESSSSPGNEEPSG